MWLSRSHDTSDESTDCSSTSSGRDSRAIIPHSVSVFTKSLHQSLEEVALARFIHDFVLERESKLAPLGYLEYLPEIYCSNGPGSSVIPVIEAVALANFSKRCHCTSQVAATASAKYRVGLRLTSEALKDPVTMRKNETLLSCYLLGMYEVRRNRHGLRLSWLTRTL